MELHLQLAHFETKKMSSTFRRSRNGRRFKMAVRFQKITVDNANKLLQTIPYII